ncbi:MAG: hypothetical protein P8J45_13840 [Phycisphaerales bacterium]|nr:hypothetical protein [Phycisphaerales bacterium]
MILLATLIIISVAGVIADDVREGPVPRPPASSGVDRLLPSSEATTLDGLQTSLRPLPTESMTVIALTSTTCPLSRKFAPLLGRMSSSDRDRGIRWIFVDVTGSDTPAEFQAFATEGGFVGDLVHDPTLELAWNLGCESNTEALVVDQRGTIRYRGCIDDRYGIGYALDEPRITPLADATEDVMEGRVVRLKATTAPGCELTPDQPSITEDAPTYHGTVSRIIQSNCMECHRKDGPGPFPLETYEEVSANAGMIKRVVTRGVMPPWFATDEGESDHGQFANDRSLAELDIAAIRDWVDGGRLRGDPDEAPLPVDYGSRWTIGTPDVIVRLPEPIAVKAEGQMPYVDIEVDPGLEEDLWVHGWEVLPTDRSVVHHALIFSVEPGKRGRFGPTDGFLGAYVPGNGYTMYGDNRAKKLTAGSRIHFQIHYAPNGRERVDQMAIGLVTSTTPPREEIHTIGIADTRIRIAPGSSDHEEQAALDIPEDVRVLSMTPHMHIRGTAFECKAIDPEGVSTTLLDVPRYDFNWQLRYVYAQPPEITKGSRIEVMGRFDNSADNPANPDPEQVVRFGKQTDDEMLIGYMEYWIPREDASPDALRDESDDAILKRQARRLIARWDKNGDEILTRDELPESRRAQFSLFDLDGDGFVGEDEFIKAARRFIR